MTAQACRSVLVVEDDKDDKKYILKTLAKFDIAVEVCPRSYEAISYLQRNDVQRPTLVLLDWKIPAGGLRSAVCPGHSVNLYHSRGHPFSFHSTRGCKSGHVRSRQCIRRESARVA